ncbi:MULTISPECIES: glycoside hydrolase family 3 N-terminal domain-containing protein [unclassified Cellulophaga]|uniref:glycoside hydrolase family 3 N-terminal domain-containing protein n=1 Tax=unclassified Cellulophaga TaxID=2634405 RepID=UPI0026E31698|nr:MULTISPECIES: glycoside hydrolase family 3 N-terminal domain-containing protein [unclassified Cellulophaga]MDO6491458.1 glycoside hydrolase family 3 N-terminal domain-containing protein [Cellulophaga sp. 2_MG-2023]MDO6493335.1 glycoside hydrolase family 3 N-terminal domain-containing protein [Cellulophaga sp. 3_MG-2023]
MRLFVSISLFFFSLLVVNGQELDSLVVTVDPLITKDSLLQKKWVDAQYNAMTLDEKVGQLFMVSVASNQNKTSTDKIKELVAKEHIGGVIFSKGGPVRQAKLTNSYQKSAKLPLLVGMDAEWGLAMRLDSTYAFPWNMTLGAIRNNAVVEKVAKQIGKHSKRLGVHINFAPDIDINTNPLNPIIGNRSFGEDKRNVAKKGIAFVNGFEKAGILSSGKHFPGHGDTSTDSHKTLPVINFSRERLDSIELYPFKKLINHGKLSSVMVAHLNIPSLDDKPNYPSSLSEKIVTNLLQKELQFKGLVFTDALNMKGVADHTDPGDADLSAFLSGNDILLMPLDVAKGKHKIIEAYNYGVITEERLARSVKKILKAKYKVGLHQHKLVDLKNLYEDLNTLENDLVYEEAIEEAITVVKNKLDLLPIVKLENKKIAYLNLGDASGKSFLQELKNYTTVTEVKEDNLQILLQKLKQYNIVIIGHHKSNGSPWKSYQFSAKDAEIVKAVSALRTSNSILVNFAKPYTLLNKNLSSLDAVVIGYQNSILAQQKTAQMLFGAIGAKGKLPVSISVEYPVGTGVKFESLKRLGYDYPERVGLSTYGLQKIDTMVRAGIDSLMFPGAQVLVARKGKIIYNKSFGKPTYESSDKITNNYIYDLASVTKILGTLPMVMKMEEENKIALNNTFKDLIPEYADTELKDVTVLKALSHYGRLPAWIAFYVSTLDKNRKPSREFYSSEKSDDYPYKVFDHLYLTKAYKDSMYNRIGRQDLKSNRYRYSDVGYYVFKKYIEDTYKDDLDKLVDGFLYQSIGANRTAYNPLNKFSKDMIVPSEKDNYYRYATVQGYVHDMGAAMQGGVGGHAGLFSNANDVAKIMQMYLQGGYYGGKRYFKERTIKKFNTCYFCDEDVRRGVGFDKPQIKGSGSTCGCVSRKSFGHSGFTGTYTWADPEEEIVYVFLSNRTYPTQNNNLLVKSGLRTRIQQVIYDSILN